MALEIREVGTSLDGATCPYCEATVLPAYDPDELEPWDPAPACEHVWGLAHDHGIAFLSSAARAQLAASGILVIDDDDLGIGLEVSEEPVGGDRRGHVGLLADYVHGDGAAILAVYAPAPIFEGTYVGIAERLG